MKKRALLGGLLLALAIPFFSQEAAQITRILAKDTADYMDFSYLISSQLGMECSPFEAYVWCDRFGTFAFNRNAGTPLTAKVLSHFLMNNYGLKGGIMWSLSRSRHYAFRELKARGLWTAGVDPDSIISGRDLIRAVNHFFTLNPDAQLREPPAGEAPARFRNALLADKEEAK